MPIFNANGFTPLPSKSNTNKQDYSRTINTSPRNYNTHSTSGTIKVYQTQSQPKIVTKEIIPTKKKTLISKTFPPKQAKTQSSSTPVSKQMIPTIKQSAPDELPTSDKSNFTTKNKCILNIVQQANN